MFRATLQKLFIRLDSSFFQIGFNIANGFKKRISRIRYFLCNEDLRAICHDDLQKS